MRRNRIIAAVTRRYRTKGRVLGATPERIPTRGAEARLCPDRFPAPPPQPRPALPGASPSPPFPSFGPSSTRCSPGRSEVAVTPGRPEHSRAAPLGAGGGELVGITAHRGCAPGPDAVSVREGSPGAGYNPQHSPTGARLVEEVPAVTCPAPVSAGAAALLELEGDGSTERLEPPRPAAAAGGARGTRHARPDPLH